MDSGKRPRKVKYLPNPRCAVKRPPPPQAKSEAVKEDENIAPQEVTTKDQVKEEYKEPWDYNHSNYPTTLPLRKPFSGNPDLLDEEEFGEAASAVEYDESTVNAASDLGLQEKVDDAKMFVFQLPSSFPFEPPTSTDKNRMGTEAPQHTSAVDDYDTSTSSSSSGNAKKKVYSLENLPAGHMGKLLVYKSGVVKLKMGDILFDVFTRRLDFSGSVLIAYYNMQVSPGIDSSFAQEIVAVNTKEKQCCSLGKPNNKWAVVTPEIESLLDNDIEDIK